MMDFNSESNNACWTELSSSFARPKVLFKDQTFAEAKERYGIFLQSQLRQFALTQNECLICHVKGKMKACYIDNQGLGHQGLGHISPTSPNNLIIVKDPWSGKHSDNPWK